MFLHNHTDKPIVCRRGDVEVPDRGISLRFANVLSFDCYRSDGARWILDSSASCPVPLRRVLQAAAWDGTSLTAHGTVATPIHGQRTRAVRIQAGSVSRTLIATGPRSWLRQGRDYVPGPPAGWQPMTLCWSFAFGGSVEMPAGKDPHSGLPHPAFTAVHPQNPLGKGFTPHPTPDGTEPPRLELADEPLKRFGDLPLPGCFAPLGVELAGMAMRPHEHHPLRNTSHASMLGPAHVAPGYLVLRWQPPGTPIELTGVVRPLSFVIPTATVRIEPRSRGNGKSGVRLRALHLDADDQTVTCIWQHALVTENRPLPDIDVALASTPS